jgi:mono/diheme cytochrome c family protein
MEQGTSPRNFQRIAKLFFLSLFVLAIAALWVVPLSARSSEPEAPPKSSGAASAPKLFGQYCARCHGADGAGSTPMGEALSAPDFTDSGWQKGKSQREMTNVVTNGKEGMPAFRKKLTRQQISSLVVYVRQFGKS